MNINDLKVVVKPKFNFGYKVGVTVHINGKKFPTEKNFVYAHNKENKAIKTALIDGGYTENHELVKSVLQKEINQKKG
tara:strand:- start:676 stop:909 length:234 start_codon:yes stop_codon:yes gene_type:complete